MKSDPQKEQERLSALDGYDILDTRAEESFDRITRLVKHILGVSISTVTFLDGHRQWFKSQIGMDGQETPRGPAFCNVVIREAAALVVPDALLDERFAQNPFVLGKPHIRFYAGFPLRAPTGEIVGTLCAMDPTPRFLSAAQLAILSDLAAIVMDELELRKLAAIDGLTGALSRRAFRQEGARVLALAQRHGHALSSIIFDLDHFKAINDGHGHSVGDLVLKEAVATCQSRLRKSDMLGRIGGEEFAVLLPLVGEKDAMTIAENMRASLARLRVQGGDGPLGVTASFGVAELDRSVLNVDALLKRADTALYAAKEDGRNRCMAWASNEEAPSHLARRVFKAGRISFNLDQSTIDCTVRTLADDHAGLDVISTAGIPQQFKLQIEVDDLYRSCRVVVKSDKHIEAAFD
jgi:diguanylate cyclase (GGDEF)-like protein